MLLELFYWKPIDVLSTKAINNRIINIDNGFLKFCYMNQLFSIFENKELFCIKYKKETTYLLYTYFALKEN